MTTPAPTENQFKELSRYQMFAPAPGVENVRARLSWSSWMGNPRITVFTNVPNDKDKGMLRAPMDPETFGILMLLLEEVIRGEPGNSRYIENFTREKTDDGSIGKMIKLSETWVGKDKDGMIWISVKAEDRPVIVFKYTVSNFHKIFKGNGEAFDAPFASSIQARSTVDGLRRIFGNLSGEIKPPYDPNAPRNGNNKNSKFKKFEKKDDFGDLDDISF